jgi:hypothetical protein
VMRTSGDGWKTQIACLIVFAVGAMVGLGCYVASIARDVAAIRALLETQQEPPFSPQKRTPKKSDSCP